MKVEKLLIHLMMQPQQWECPETLKVRSPRHCLRSAQQIIRRVQQSLKALNTQPSLSMLRQLVVSMGQDIDVLPHAHHHYIGHAATQVLTGFAVKTLYSTQGQHWAGWYAERCMKGSMPAMDSASIFAFTTHTHMHPDSLCS